jgi:hypothetical protein
MTNFQYFYDNVTALGRHVNHDERSKELLLLMRQA